jgi:hypothetical protein
MTRQNDMALVTTNQYQTDMADGRKHINHKAASLSVLQSD